MEHFFSISPDKWIAITSVFAVVFVFIIFYGLEVRSRAKEREVLAELLKDFERYRDDMKNTDTALR